MSVGQLDAVVLQRDSGLEITDQAFWLEAGTALKVLTSMKMLRPPTSCRLSPKVRQNARFAAVNTGPCRGEGGARESSRCWAGWAMARYGTHSTYGHEAWPA